MDASREDGRFCSSGSSEVSGLTSNKLTLTGQSPTGEVDRVS